MSLQLVLILLFAVLVMSCVVGAESPKPVKQHSIFFPPELIQQAATNSRQFDWAAEIHRGVIDTAQPWLRYSDEALWEMMFGNTLRRSWMVWSNGYCPACKAGVPMYTWIIEPHTHPWKVQCPHCQEFFPKNDFTQFYHSGLDAHGVFDPNLADRSLLFNMEHPNPDDTLHLFGVDDGHGFSDGTHQWHFISAYLIYGHWKKLILAGIKNLAAAYVVTGDQKYAHQAGILLDRVADLYPTFDFAREGLVYERKGDAGYISTWHDACEETRELALAYDYVFDGIKNDPALVEFLARKAAVFQLANPKTSFALIQQNIEERILRDALNNPKKTATNYPRQEVAFIVIETVIGWPENREHVLNLFDSMLAEATAVDGVTGEKGLTGYATIGPRAVAEILGQYARFDSDFLKSIFTRHPKLHQLYRFHIDTWCLQKYYPQIGDGGVFGQQAKNYCALAFSQNPGIQPADFTFLWKLFELTSDTALVQVLYRANQNSTQNLPCDLFAENPLAYQKAVAAVIGTAGAELQQESVNKSAWHLAILRGGSGENARALWLAYDSDGRHSHANGLNLGLFAKGIDLLPDFGYPPVQYGGWEAPKAMWYRNTISHNTVMVDRQNHLPAAGETTLWAIGKTVQALRVNGPKLIGGQQFERTLVLVEISPEDFYVVDLFRVIGGREHFKFLHSYFGEMTARGLKLTPTDACLAGEMRNFRLDSLPQTGWSVDWKITDRYNLLAPDADVHLRYTDFTPGTQVFTAEAWVMVDGFNTYAEAWIPRLLVRRESAQAPLVSTFVGVLEPYAKNPKIREIRRRELTVATGATAGENHVALEIKMNDGRRDLFVLADAENSLTEANLQQPKWDLSVSGAIGFVRLNAVGEPEQICLAQGSRLKFKKLVVELKHRTEVFELHREARFWQTVTGQPDLIRQLVPLKR